MPKRKNLIRAIPTTYKGIKFRSRLESWWARLFDTLEWDWTYEPDLQVGFVIPDFLIGFPHPVVIECKPAVTVEEISAHRRKLIRKMPAWLADDVLRERAEISAQLEVVCSDGMRVLEDLERVSRGENPTGFSRRVLVAGPRLFSEDGRVSLDGSYGFCLCTHVVAKSHIGLSLSLGSTCLACGQESRSWVPPEMMLGAWREAGAAQQWRPKKGKRKR